MSGEEKDTCVYSVGNVIDRGVEMTYAIGGNEGVMLGVGVEDFMKYGERNEGCGIAYTGEDVGSMTYGEGSEVNITYGSTGRIDDPCMVASGPCADDDSKVVSVGTLQPGREGCSGVTHQAPPLYRCQEGGRAGGQADREGGYGVIVDEREVLRGMEVRGEIKGEGLRVGHLNVNTYDSRESVGLKDEAIVRRMKVWELDILFLMDCRLDEGQSRMVRGRLGDVMTHVYGTTGGRILDSPHIGGNSSSERVGGMLVLVSPRLRGTFVELRKCVMGMGICVEVGVKTEEGMVAIVGVYWPTGGEGEFSLRSKVARWMKKEKKRGDPREWVRGVTGGKIMARQRAGAGVVVLGDFNMLWGELREWAEAHGVEDLTDGSGVTTNRLRGGRIDHVLGWNVGIFNWGIDDSTIARDVSDHRAMWVELVVKANRVKTRDRKKGAKSTVFLGTEEEWIRFAKEVEWGEVKDMTIDDMMENYMRAAKKVGGRRKVRTYFNGWSPVMLAIKMYLNFVRKVRSHIVGRRGYYKWGRGELVRRGVDVESLKLESMLQRLKLKEEDSAWLMAKLEPAIAWRLRDPSAINLAFLTAQETLLKKRLHGRVRTELRKRINDKVLAREEAREQGKLKGVIDSMMGNFKEPIVWNMVRVGDGIVFGDREVMEVYNGVMERWYGPEEFPEATDDSYWDDIFGDAEAFRGRMRDSRIPEELQNIIWRAIQNRDMGREKERVAEELNRTLSPADPPSFEEFKDQICKCRRGGKAAGPSGVTYDMLWRISDESKERLYVELCKIWATLEYPESWGRRWMKLIPKGEGGDAESVRPISLVEVARKVWNKLILKRIINMHLDQGGGLSRLCYK